MLGRSLPFLAFASVLLGQNPGSFSDGLEGRRQDGMVWKREDVGPDGTHPSMPGREKVARMLLAFLKSDATARIWFEGQER